MIPNECFAQNYANQPLLPSQQAQQNFQNNWAYQNMQQQMPVVRQEPQILAVSISSPEEVDRYPVAPGRTIFLIDYANKQFWLKRKDDTGLMITCIHHTFISDEDAAKMQTPQHDSSVVTREEFDELKRSIEELLK